MFIWHDCLACDVENSAKMQFHIVAVAIQPPKRARSASSTHSPAHCSEGASCPCHRQFMHLSTTLDAGIHTPCSAAASQLDLQVLHTSPPASSLPKVSLFNCMFSDDAQLVTFGGPDALLSG